MEGWKQRNKGRADKGKEELATVCYFLFPQSLCWGAKMEGENERMKEEGAGRWKQVSEKDEDNEQMPKIKGIWGGIMETRQRWFQRGKTRGVKTQKMAGEVMERAEEGC